jgi:hypothetical protein
MAHFAEIDESSFVTRVLVTNNEDPNNDEGYQWLIDTFGGTWIKTSYNTHGGIHTLGGTPLRKNYAGVGMSYDPIRDAFITKKPFELWVLNEETCIWEAPVAKPTNDREYKWNEETLSWDIFEE